MKTVPTTQRVAVQDAADFGRVAVMYGGISSEREVSLQSGKAVLDALLARNVDAHAWDPAENQLRDFADAGFDRVWIALHGLGGEDGAIQGEELLVRFHATPQATRTFCRVCGGQIFFQGERWPGEIHIARALLDDAADLAPTYHAFFSHKAPWMEVHDALPKRGGETGVEPLAEE